MYHSISAYYISGNCSALADDMPILSLGGEGLQKHITRIGLWYHENE